MQTGAGFRGSALRAARLRRGLTQHQLAAAVGVAGGERVHRWESGAAAPNSATVRRLADALGIDVMDLLPAGLRDLHVLRISAGYRSRDLAAAAGMSDSTYRRWEAGSIGSVPNRDALRPLADALRVDVNEVAAAIDQAIIDRTTGTG